MNARFLVFHHYHHYCRVGWHHIDSHTSTISSLLCNSFLKHLTAPHLEKSVVPCWFLLVLGLSIYQTRPLLIFSLNPFCHCHLSRTLTVISLWYTLLYLVISQSCWIRCSVGLVLYSLVCMLHITSEITVLNITLNVLPLLISLLALIKILILAFINVM